MYADKLSKEKKTINRDQFRRQVGSNITFCSNEQQKLNKRDNFYKNRGVNSNHQRAYTSTPDFVKSLVCKIQSVERVKAKSFVETQVKVKKGQCTKRQIKYLGNDDETNKKQYLKLIYVDNIIQQNYKAKKGDRSRQLQGNRSLEQQFLKLREQNKELKQKIKHLVSVIQSYDSSMNHIDFKKKDVSIAELKYLCTQKTYSFKSEMLQITSKMALIEKQNQQLKIQRSRHYQNNQKYALNIIKNTINQIIFPLCRQSSQKSQKERNKINIEIDSLKKQFELSYNQLKQSKDIQIEKMRQAFSLNLNNFKDIMLKRTSNSIQRANTLLQNNKP